MVAPVSPFPAFRIGEAHDFHRAFDRRTFATGAVRAALWAVSQPPKLYSMMDVLGMV